MAVQKKHGKGRLDKWYRLAKEKGYRARAAFKLIQLNQKYKFLEQSKVLLDLCAAPGSWLQVAAEAMPSSALIVGIDLAPIKPIPKCITFQGDITTDKCRATIRQHFKTWKADTVLHDGAPNVGISWIQDAYSQAELTLHALKLATEFLIEGGTFVTKVFRSKDYNSLLWVMNQLFLKVEATKPVASRNVSAEIFVICRGFKAPIRIDPRLLNPKTVFAELEEGKPDNESKIFRPEIKKRKRDGYEEGNWTQYKETSAIDYINSKSPIDCLAQHNRFTFELPKDGDLALETLNRLPDTTSEIRECCADLKVLGRKEFKMILRWRSKTREMFGLEEKGKKNVSIQDNVGEDVVRIESMDDELKLQEELQRQQDMQDAKKKRERRRENERKRKEIVRMQMNMTAPTEIGLEQNGPIGEGSLFSMNAVKRADAASRFAYGRMYSAVSKDIQVEAQQESTESDDEAVDNLEESLDAMYLDYKERKASEDAKYRAKMCRSKISDEWVGCSGSEDEQLVEDSSDGLLESGEGSSGSVSSEDYDDETKKDFSLSSRASHFFGNAIFHDFIGIEDENNSSLHERKRTKEGLIRPSEAASLTQSSATKAGVQNQAYNDNAIEFVKRDDDPFNSTECLEMNGKPNIDIITTEAMSLAQAMATGKRSKEDIVDDSFNRYTLRDVDGLPEWFKEDEDKHTRPNRPITSEAAAAIKEKLRMLNARPIKKVREAKQRKQLRAARRLEKLRKKSANVAEEQNMSEGDKARQISRLMSKAVKKKPKDKVKVVVARGGNRGISGRPKGTKGRYRMVDARLKKDMKAQKRLQQKTKRR